MVTLTGVGVYIVVVYLIGIGLNLGAAVFTEDGFHMDKTSLILGSIWSAVNLWLLLNYGFNV